MATPKDAAFTSRCDFVELKEYFSSYSKSGGDGAHDEPVMDSTGSLNPILIRGVPKGFLQNVYIRSTFYMWLVVVMREVARNLVLYFWKAHPGYLLDEQAAQVFQSRKPQFHHP
ncbi:hypothetical protein M9H77_22641 [Catharanthus roseus]|uniref:Uncharacterized protein n=1 Tax=Catharanthus roseus TaxID=4058 RepID=A0ACC0ATP7_CATRO|nr:hypothetical protein M9H77_22641 [Catharanthus roseus]